MRHGLLFTVFNRLTYLQQSLHTWESVDRLLDWPILFSVDPSPLTKQVVQELEEFIFRTGHAQARIVVQPEHLGVLKHPHVGFQKMFNEGFDFVVRCEDDLIVSNDILRFFEFAAERYAPDRRIGAVNASSKFEAGDPSAVILRPYFSPLTWGTWADRWSKVIGPTWDHDYSTHNGVPGTEAGWDWNLNTRIFPQRGLVVAAPIRSRVDNIGVHGTHSDPENFSTLPGFEPYYAVREFSA